MKTARASLATSDSGLLVPVSAEAGQYNLQWMPPGQQDIACWVNGKPRRLSFNVTANLAELFDRQLQTMLDCAKAGNGDKPLTDYNHEDREASSRPTSITWGGNDPKTGGIRLIGKWTSSARAAIRDEEFDRFSPQWDFDENTGAPVGITVNLGGLVNKAAFKSIATVQASDSSSEINDSSESFRANDESEYFLNLVKSRAASKNILFLQAFEDISRENPAAATACAKAMRGAAAPLPLENHPFLVQSKAMAAARGMSVSDAQIKLARDNYPLYQKYLASLRPEYLGSHQKSGQSSTGKAADSGRQDFLREIQTNQARGMSFDKSLDMAAASRPDLLEGYKRSFAPNRGVAR
jgi:hypothetical protein